MLKRDSIVKFDLSAKLTHKYDEQVHSIDLFTKVERSTNLQHILNTYYI